MADKVEKVIEKKTTNVGLQFFTTLISVITKM